MYAAERVWLPDERCFGKSQGHGFPTTNHPRRTPYNRNLSDHLQILLSYASNGEHAILRPDDLQTTDPFMGHNESKSQVAGVRSRVMVVMEKRVRSGVLVMSVALEGATCYRGWPGLRIGKKGAERPGSTSKM